MSKKPRKIKPNEKIKILLYGYSPAITSGLSTVTQNIANILSSSSNIQLYVYGINDHGNPKDPKVYPYPIYSFANKNDTDIYSRNHFLSVIRGNVEELTPPFDIVIVFLSPHLLTQSTDYHRDGVMAFIRSHQKETYMKKPSEFWFKTIGYFPIDAPVTTSQINNAIAISDQPLMLSMYGQDQVLHTSPALEKATDIIPPAVNTNDFHPLSKSKNLKFRDQYFRGEVDASTLLITSVAKNYYLSDLTRTLEIHRQFISSHPNSFLYLHTDAHGPFVDLEAQAKNMGLELFTHWAYSGSLSAGQFSSREQLNQIYNASDIILSTSHATWWGNSILEAFATQSLVVAPYHTAFTEHLSSLPLDSTELTKSTLKSLRGIPIDSNQGGNAWTSYGVADNQLIRPLASIPDALEKLTWIINNPDQVKKIKKRSYQYALDHSLTTIAPLWKKKISQVFSDLTDERKDPQATITKYFV